MALGDEVRLAGDPEEDPKAQEDEEEEEEEEEEELIDPFQVLKDDCRNGPECKQLEKELQKCTDRVNSRSNTNETCLDELIDHVQCVDNCAARDIWSKLK